jgi:hypothetical protein
MVGSDLRSVSDTPRSARLRVPRKRSVSRGEGLAKQDSAHPTPINYSPISTDKNSENNLTQVLAKKRQND